MMRKLIILCAGDFGREIANVVERINDAADEPQWELLGFVDDNMSLQGKLVDGYPVLETIDDLNGCTEERYVICSAGVAKTRKKILERITNQKIKFATLIDPDARVYRDANVGEGSIICGGSILAIGVQVKKHVIVNLNCSLGHDSIYEDYCVVNPGVNVSGNVHVKECCDLGTGAKVIQGLSIGPNTVIGAGAAVIRDIPADCLAVGVPAKVK